MLVPLPLLLLLLLLLLRAGCDDFVGRTVFTILGPHTRGRGHLHTERRKVIVCEVDQGRRRRVRVARRWRDCARQRLACRRHGTLPRRGAVCEPSMPHRELGERHGLHLEQWRVGSLWPAVADAECDGGDVDVHTGEPCIDVGRQTAAIVEAGHVLELVCPLERLEEAIANKTVLESELRLIRLLVPCACSECLFGDPEQIGTLEVETQV